MQNLSSFEAKIQTEVCNYISAPVDFRDVVVTLEERYEENKRISLYQMKRNSLIVTAPSLYEKIAVLLKELGSVSRITAAKLKDLMGLEDHEMGDRTVYLFLDPSDYAESPPGEQFTISRIDGDYQREFAEFTRGCPERDLNEGVVSLEDPVVYGCFEGERLVGAASYWFWGEKLADIGIIVHPGYRRLGLGRALVSRLCNWGINNQKINLYRHNEKNRNSHRLALSLNFREHLFVEYLSL